MKPPPLDRDEAEIVDRLADFLQRRPDSKFASYEPLRSWAEACIGPGDDAPAIALAIIKRHLSADDLADPWLLAAGWLMLERTSAQEQILADTGRSAEDVLKERFKAHGNDPNGNKEANHLIAVACLDGIPREERWGAFKSTVNTFRPSSSGTTPGARQVAFNLMRAAEAWFEKASLIASGVPAVDVDAATPNQINAPALEGAPLRTVASLDGLEVESPGTVAPSRELGPDADESSERDQDRPSVRPEAGLDDPTNQSLWRSLLTWLGMHRRMVVVTLAIAVVLTIIFTVTRPLLTEPATPQSSAPLTQVRSLNGGATTVAAASWGPTSRHEIAADGRSPGAVMNSIFNNPSFGDERQFVRVKQLEAPDRAYTDKIAVEPGKVYQGQIYVHNDAAAGDANSAAQGVRLHIQMPDVMTGSTSATATISSTNASPKAVWDGFTLLLPASDAQASLRYVSNSAVFTTVGGQSFHLSDDAFGSNGVLLGCAAQDGVLPADDKCAGYVTFSFRVDQPNFAVAAVARVSGSDAAFTSSVTAAPGDVLEVGLSYQNTGSTQQDNVILRVPNLPTGFQYVPGSTQVVNSRTGGKLTDTIDGIVSSTGLNIGSFQPHGNAFYSFKVLIDPNMKLADSGLGWIKLSPLVRITTSGGNKTADLTVVLVGK